MDTTRPTVVDGAFYPRSPGRLQADVRSLMETVDEPRHDLLACLAPHAGYVYSGGVAGRVFAHLRLPPVVLLMGPNHTGRGARVACAPHDAWSSPLGPVPVDGALRQTLLERSPRVELDDRAHLQEHSLEVMLPFLRERRPDVRVVPVCLAHLSRDECLAFGAEVAAAVSGFAEPVGIVASTDMSHYVSDDEARRLDRLAIDAALALDPAGLYDTVHAAGITMCGVVPATVALAAANALGATAAHLVHYATSGDVSGDRSAVVGYAGICVH
jgi:AmmeMemoRadiSam system protein B